MIHSTNSKYILSITEQLTALAPYTGQLIGLFNTQAITSGLAESNISEEQRLEILG